MGIFNRNDKPGEPLHVKEPGSIWAVPPTLVNYETVLDYLVGLSNDDYKVINEVAVIYRKANAEAAKAQGIENEPTSFIKQPSNLQLVPETVNHVDHQQPKSFLDDDDDADIAAILDEPEFLETQPAAKPGMKISAKKPKG